MARLLAEEEDEYQRHRHVRASLFGLGTLLTLATIWGFFEQFDLVPHVPTWAAVPVFALGLGLAQLHPLGTVMNNRLKVLRAERDWSQGDLAEKLEVSRQSVNAIETGKYDPSLPLAFRIAELFDLSIEQIFTAPSRHQSKAI